MAGHYRNRLCKVCGKTDKEVSFYPKVSYMCQEHYKAMRVIRQRKRKEAIKAGTHIVGKYKNRTKTDDEIIKEFEDYFSSEEFKKSKEKQ